MYDTLFILYCNASCYAIEKCIYHKTKTGLPEDNPVESAYRDRLSPFLQKRLYQRRR